MNVLIHIKGFAFAPLVSEIKVGVWKAQRLLR